MFGVSLRPQLFCSDDLTDADKKLLKEYGGETGLLKALRGLGVTHIELRSVSSKADPEDILRCANKLWSFGFTVTVHGSLTGEILPFSEVYPSLLPMLSEAKKHQPSTVITLHSYTTGDDENKIPAAENTNKILKLWSEDAEEYGFRLALELNRDKHNGDPSVTCEGVLAMLSGTDPQKCGICFDFGHYYSNTKDTDPQEIPSGEFLSRTIHTHIHALGSKGTHFPICAETVLPLSLYVSALYDSGYTGVWNFEPDFPRYTDRSYRTVIRDSVTAIKASYRAKTPYSQTDRERTKLSADSAMPSGLEKIALALEKGNSSPKFWSFCPSGQIFDLGDIKFAVDPAIRSAAARDNCKEIVRRIFSKLDLVFITHDHDDHFDTALTQSVCDLPITWIVGSNISREILNRSGLTDDKIIIISPGEKKDIRGLTVEAFEGCHFGTDGSGIPSVMYLITACGKKFFFPADIRDYSAHAFPDIEAPDYMFANVWLGRSMACSDCGASVEEYCDYVSFFKPKTVFLGHLMEYTRSPGNMWRWEHAGKVMDGLELRLPSIPAIPLQLYRAYEL